MPETLWKQIIFYDTKTANKIDKSWENVSFSLFNRDFFQQKIYKPLQSSKELDNNPWMFLNFTNRPVFFLSFNVLAKSQ